jgi:pre-peptidase
MKHPGSHAWGRKLLLISVLFFIAILTLNLKAIQMTSAASYSRFQVDTPYPTNYPPGKQTLEAIERQTQAAAALVPLPLGTDRSFLPLTPTPGPWELTPFPSTPAGDGVIYDFYMGSMSKDIGVNITNKWYAEIGDRHFNVFAGSDYNDPAQGMVYVIVFAADGSRLSNGDYYPTADRSGAVHVVSAVGSRLILLSTGGQTYYFDVPGRQFTTSLTETVPTVTPLPYTPYPTNTPAFTDDAPNTPDDIHGLSPVNTTLTFKISPSGDEDWFRFNLPTPGTIQVQLTNLPANYDLYVYEVSLPNGGQSTQSGNTDEIVTIPDAQADDYIVRVVGVNGTFDSTHPYQLRFNTPPSQQG